MMRFQDVLLPCWVMVADIWFPGETRARFTGAAG